LEIPFKDIRQSDKKDKKIAIDIITPSSDSRARRNGVSTVHFGAKGSQTFIEGASEKKRDAYRARHSKIMMSNGKPAYLQPYTSAFMSWNLLW
jgi:hypothetical protein